MKSQKARWREYCQGAGYLARALVVSALAGWLHLPTVAAQRVADEGNALDVVVFGDPASEKGHQVSGENAKVTDGALGESALHLMPTAPVSFKGGSVSFTMKVDPERQNFLTVKLWGSDKGRDSGRLILFAQGLQVGYRFESDYDVLNQCDDEPQAAGRFFYVTLPLPQSLTRGKTSLDLKIGALGPIWYYGRSFTQYQRDLTQPTRGIYRAYTHSDSRFVPAASENQGHPPDTLTRATHGEEVIEQSKEVVKERLARTLEAGRPGDSPKTAGEQLLLLSEAYNVPWTPAFQNPKAIDRIVQNGDALAEIFSRDPKGIPGSWTGAGPLGHAIVRTWPAVQAKLDEEVKVGQMTMVRRKLWADVLKRSVDYWRTHRRSYTNQSMIVDYNIYLANRALRLVEPSLALPEAQAMSYVYQSVGLEPWLGSDSGAEATGERDVPMENIHAPYGKGYYLVTRKGLSRELGWVGSYGETIGPFIYDMSVFLGDEKLREQLRKMQTARLFFRYPGVDADGYRCMKLSSEIDNRTAHYPQSGSAYNSPDVREAWWMDIASLFPDAPLILGAAQQSVDDGQYFSYVAQRLKDPNTLGMMRNVEQWETVRKMPRSGKVLPTTPGQPDFGFADEENAVLVIKNGDTCLFINLYYRAENGVNRVARVWEVSPATARLATVLADVEVIPSGESYTRPDWIDRIRSRGFPPPGEEIHQAYAGEVLPVSRRPDDAVSPQYGGWGPFLGRAAFYRLRYGDYLIGLNTTESETYELPVTGGLPHRDLVSGRVIRPEKGVVKVAPLSTVVLYLGGQKGLE